jgi:diguanylate cyclase (GGDEF)-like protein
MKHAESTLQHLATHDPLTGLPNRFLMLDRLAQILARSERDRGTFALAFADIDDFKNVNDTLGHAVGDRVLRTVGERISAALRTSDTVARISGDEFVAIIDGVKPNGVGLITEKVRRAVARPLPLGKEQLRVTVSLGVSLYPLHSRNVDGLLNLADEAMYRAKKAGKDAVLIGPANAA